jgi:hypothetical protein
MVLFFTGYSYRSQAPNEVRGQQSGIRNEPNKKQRKVTNGLSQTTQY